MERRLALTAIALSAALVLTGCSDNGEELITFENVKFRRNAAHEAFIATVGLARKEGVTRYELKYTPHLNALALRKAATNDRLLRLVIKGQLSGEFEALRIKSASPDESRAPRRLYLLRVADINSLVKQLNTSTNQRYRDLMSGDANYRIATSSTLSDSTMC